MAESQEKNTKLDLLVKVDQRGKQMSRRASEIELMVLSKGVGFLCE